MNKYLRALLLTVFVPVVLIESALTFVEANIIDWREWFTGRRMAIMRFAEKRLPLKNGGKHGMD